MTAVRVDAGAGRISTPPRVLIHLHIRKTGGTSLNSAIKHAFERDEVFELYADGDCEHTGLDTASIEGISRVLTDFGLDRLRYVSGHIPFGVHRLFGSDAKYLTLIREPVDRVISTFFWFRAGRPFCRDGKPLSFEEYLEAGDVYLNNYQVRVLSDAPEFNDVTCPSGVRELTFGAPVERRHLEQAKRNIENHFLVAAPLEELVETALLLRRMYDWPTRRLHNEYKNHNQNRPHAQELSSKLREIIERNNAYDLELYRWVKHRFAAQRALFEPQLSRDLVRFRRTNAIITGLGKYFPHKVRKKVAAAVLHGRGVSLDFLTRKSLPQRASKQS